MNKSPATAYSYTLCTMNTHLKDGLIFLVLIASSFTLWNLFVGMSAIDIQIHDTYFAFDWTSWAFLIVGLVTFFYFLARGLVRKFSTIGTNVGLMVGQIAVLLIIFKFFQMLLVVSSPISVSAVGGLLILGTVWMILLMRRTYRQWRREYSR
ncbi:MAG: hypothetical protein C0490_15800 [Marivirga sp.]|nr:hypothetical protein [Marivirga sp.]